MPDLWIVVYIEDGRRWMLAYAVTGAGSLALRAMTEGQSNVAAELSWMDGIELIREARAEGLSVEIRRATKLRKPAVQM